MACPRSHSSKICRRDPPMLANLCSDQTKYHIFLRVKFCKISGTSWIWDHICVWDSNHVFRCWSTNSLRPCPCHACRRGRHNASENASVRRRVEHWKLPRNQANQKHSTVRPETGATTTLFDWVSCPLCQNTPVYIWSSSGSRVCVLSYVCHIVIWNMYWFVILIQTVVVVVVIIYTDPSPKRYAVTTIIYPSVYT